MLRKVGDWVVDDQTDTIARGELRRKLERRAMAVLTHLAERAGQVVSKDELLDSVWGGAAVSDHSVAIAISQLRRALDDAHSPAKYIETIPKRGYRLVATVTDPPVENQMTPDRRLLLAGGLGLAAFAAGVAYLPNFRRRYVIAVADFGSAPEIDAANLAFALSEMVSIRLFEQIRTRALRWRGAISADGQARLTRSAGPAHDVALLTGLVYSDRGAIVASAQLRDSGTQDVLHSGVYQLEGVNLALQAGNIASDAAAAAGYDAAPPDAGAPPDAMARYWQALYAFAKDTPGARRRSRDLLVSLTNDYPNFAPAHASLAGIYVLTTPETLGMPGTDNLASAARHLAIAKRLGGETGDVATIAALLAFYEARNLNAGLAHAARATALAPTSSRAWQAQALLLSVGGQHEAALDSIRRALDLAPTSLELRWDYVWALYAAGHYRGAWREVQTSAQATPSHPLYAALVYDALAERDAAFEQWMRRERMRGLDETQESVVLRAARRNGFVEGYAALLAATASHRREAGVPLAVLRINAGDVEGAVTALLGPSSSWDRWLLLFVDRIVNLRGLRQDARLAGLFTRIADFRASRQQSRI
jgi:DNA-binding winged helix-turn-helix (wHTH) protein/tetratricopeptide (TPR) repeat protein